MLCSAFIYSDRSYADQPDNFRLPAAEPQQNVCNVTSHDSNRHDSYSVAVVWCAIMTIACVRAF